MLLLILVGLYSLVLHTNWFSRVGKFNLSIFKKRQKKWIENKWKRTEPKVIEKLNTLLVINFCTNLL